MGQDEDDDSAPCFAHLLVDGHVVDPQTRRDVAAFRKAERQRLYALRKTLSVSDRAAAETSIAQGIDDVLDDPTGRTIAAYWPIRGEPDLRRWMAQAHERGARIALPVVVARDAPVGFHLWSPGCAMERGIWNIPVPRDVMPVVPDVVIVPLLGVDDALFRLGNGGGYYDRTLVRLPGPHRVIGVGYGFSRMTTIYPMPWDVPMDVIVLDDGTIQHRQ